MASTRIGRALKALEVRRDTDTSVKGYVQRDNRPLPPSRRNYGPLQFVLLWVVTGSFNVGGWTTGSSLISLGLNVWQSMLVVIIGNIFAGILCVLGGHPGAKWHISFPYFQRAVWGVWGAWFPMLNRVFLSFIWTSTNTWYGGQCVKTFLLALWPSFANLNKQLAGGTMMVNDLVAFVIFIVLCLPLMWISPERYKIPFMIFSTTLIVTVFALLIWATTSAHGGGSLLSDVSRVSGVTQATGSVLGWHMMSGIVATIGGTVTHMLSQSDYTRYARKPKDQYWAQLIMVPLGSIVVSIIGIVCASCAAQLYPQNKKLLWQPYALLDAIRVGNDNSSGARAGVAFASIAFIFSQFGITVASNAVVAGIDLAGLFPQWFTIRRGGYVTVLFVFVMQPWQLLNSATNFLTVIGGYSLFLGPLMGVMFADYFILRKRNLKLTALYEVSPESIYWFTGGWNWRAPVAFVMGVWPTMPGFAYHIRQPASTITGWTHIYWLGFFVGTFTALATYLLLDLLSPIQHKTDVDDEDYFGTFNEVLESVDNQSQTPSAELVPVEEIKHA